MKMKLNTPQSCVCESESGVTHNYLENAAVGGGEGKALGRYDDGVRCNVALTDSTCLQSNAPYYRVIITTQERRTMTFVAWDASSG